MTYKGAADLVIAEADIKIKSPKAFSKAAAVNFSAKGKTDRKLIISYLDKRIEKPVTARRIENLSIDLADIDDSMLPDILYVSMRTYNGDKPSGEFCYYVPQKGKEKMLEVYAAGQQ